MESSPADMPWKLRGLYSPQQVHLRRLFLLSLKMYVTILTEVYGFYSTDNGNIKIGNLNQ